MNTTVKNVTIYGLTDITKSDETTYDANYRYGDALLCTADGNVNVGFHDGSNQVFALTAGDLLRVSFKYVFSTSTTATVRGVKLNP